MSDEFTVRVPAGTARVRVDRILAEMLPEIGRSQIKQRAEHLTVNGRPAKLATHVAEGDLLVVRLGPPPVVSLVGEEIPLAIIAETNEYVVVNKEQGMVVHPGAGHHAGTLVHALLGRYRNDPFFSPSPEDATGTDGADDGDSIRPGIVHRLDRETSGVIIVARTARTHAWLVEQFASRRVAKWYLAVVKGSPRHDEARIDGAVGRHPHHRVRFSVRGPFVVTPLVSEQSTTAVSAQARHHIAVPPTQQDVPRGARSASTTYRVLARYGDQYSLVLLQPHTGRTHQLRVHMHRLGHPILGDDLYARGDQHFPDVRLMLHALRLRIRPTPEAEVCEFRAPPPKRFRRVLSVLAVENRSGR